MTAVQTYSTNSSYWAKTSSIEALSLAISVGIGVGGVAGIGISGAGAEATNVILTDVNAYASDSSLKALQGNVKIEATNTASIDAAVVAVSAAFGAGGTAGVGVSIGVAVARNYIGWDTSSDLFPEASIDFSTGDSLRNQFTRANPLTTGDLVRIDAGARAGDVYKYVGDTIQADFNSSQGTRTVSEGDVVLISSNFTADSDSDGTPDGKIGGLYKFVGTGGSRNLNAQDYTDGDIWEYVGSSYLVEQDYGNTDYWQQVNIAQSPAEVQAYSERTSITTGGALTMSADSDNTIEAVVVSGSVALSGGFVGVAVSGSGVGATNRIATLVQSYIDGDGTNGIDAGSVSLSADDTSNIDAVAAAASLAGALAGVAVSVSIGVSVAENIITNDVSAYIRNADTGVIARTGEILVEATENAAIESDAVAASVSVAIGVIGVALSGAGADATNIVSNSVTSYIVDSTVETEVPQDYLSSQQINVLERGKRVLIVPDSTGANGYRGTAGQVYEYIGTTTGSSTDPVGLAGERYLDATQWKLISVGSKDIVIDAQNTSSIDSVVGAVAVSASGGLIAAAGSVGVTLSDNVIGTIEQKAFNPDTLAFETLTFQNQAMSWIENSVVDSAQDLVVTASSEETIDSEGYAGSAAIAIGIGAALAGAGVEVSNVFDTVTYAWIDQSDVTAGGDLTVQATSDSELVSSSANGVAISVSLGSLSIAASLVDTEITNDVRAWISGDSNDSVYAAGDLLVDASVLNAKIQDVSATTVGLSIGLITVTGGGLDIQNTIDNTVSSAVSGDLTIMAAGDIEVTASENAYLEADAANVSLAIGLGLAIGVSLVKNEILSDISASVAGTLSTALANVTAANLTVLAQSTADIEKTDTVGVAGALLGAVGNRADADIKTQVTANVSNAVVTVAGTVTVNANAVNSADAYAGGGAFGGFAAGAMIADIEVGRGAGVDEVRATIGDNTTITADALAINATGVDTLRATSVSAAVGAISIAGAQSDVDSDQATLASIGENVSITVGSLTVSSVQSQDFDAQSDAVSFGLAAGTGAGVDNDVNTRANIDIGTGSGGGTIITADSIYITVLNNFAKDEYAEDNNLRSGSFSGISLDWLESTTTLTTEATVDIGPGTVITALGTNATPGRVQIAAVNTGTALDSVRMESFSLLGAALTVGRSIIDYTGDAEINLDGAYIENKTGDVSLSTSSETQIRGTASLFIASTLSGAAGADVDIDNTVNNVITVDDSTIKGNDVDLMSGLTSNGTVNLLDASANAEIFAISLYPNIVVPVVTADIVETNQVDVLGSSILQALQDVSLLTNSGIGDDRASTTGTAMSLSLIPYGFPVPDGADDVVSNVVNIDSTALIEAGLYNMSVVQVLPVTVNGSVEDDLLGGSILTRLNSSSDVPGVGRRLSDAELAALTPALPAGLKYEYAWVNVDAIEFSISSGTIVQVVAGANQGGIVGHYYEYRLSTKDGPDRIVMEQQDFSDTKVWRDLGTTLTTAQQQQKQVYSSDVTVAFAASLANKFYVIKPVELPTPKVSYVNVGNLLLEQREEIVSWIISHAGDTEALARYQAQLEELDRTLEELGLTEYFTVVDTSDIVFDVAGQRRYQFIGANEAIVLTDENFSDTARWTLLSGTTKQSGDISSDNRLGERLVKRELDTLFLNIPSIYASPGSVYIEREGLSTESELAARTGYQNLVNSGRIIARAGAQISVNNQTPFTTVINDAIIRDNKRVEVIDGVYTVFEPGNVWLNSYKFTDNSGAAAPQISITQDSFPIGYYDFGSSSSLATVLTNLDQDMYLVGDVINENGALIVDNREGSIIVSGQIRAETVSVTAIRDFNLNTEGWLHAGKDPRQYLTWDTQRAAAVTDADNTLVYTASSDVSGLNTAITAPSARILAQGRISINARLLNVNGLIQSGVDTIKLEIASDFNPGRRTVNLTDDDGVTLSGISFGPANIPVDGFFDSARNAIVLEDIVPTGGEILIAGQILSTGNGMLRVANGYTSVDIKNSSRYDLVLNRVDTTTDRKGKITIIDTGRGTTIHKDVYEVSAGRVEYKHYTGVEASQPINSDGVVAAINYTLQSTSDAGPVGSGVETTYATRAGLQYVWVEGQSKTKTTYTEYQTKSFNLLGDNSLADWLVKDANITEGPTINYTDDQPLLESETLEVDGTSKVPTYAVGSAYSIKYEQIGDTNIDAVKNVTKVYVGGDESTGFGGQWYLYVADSANIYLPGQTYASNTSVWQPRTANQLGIVVNSDLDIGVLNRALNQYPDSFDGTSVDSDTWTEGGGWMRYKTVYASTTTIEGLKDVYTSTLKASYPISLDFQQGPASPEIRIETKNNLILDGDMESPEHGRIILSSATGSITSSNGVAIYGATPKLEAGSDANDIISLNIEGNKIPSDAQHSKTANEVTLRKGELVERDNGLYRFTGNGKVVDTSGNSVTVGSTGVRVFLNNQSYSDQRNWVKVADASLDAEAGGDITLNAVSLNNSSSRFKIGNIDSEKGDVLINAPDGIYAGSASSQVRGELVEFDAFRGAIGSSSLSLRVNSDIDGIGGTGGLAARRVMTSSLLKGMRRALLAI